MNQRPQAHLISDGDRHAIFLPEQLIALGLDEEMLAAIEAGDPLPEASEIVQADPEACSELSCSAECAELPASPLDGLPDDPGAASRDNCDCADGRLNRLVLHTTHDCNLRCVYCYAEGGSYGRPRHAMPREIALTAINWAVATFGGVRTVQFFGGEPLMNPKLIFEVCEYFNALREAGQIEELPAYALVTNGVLADERVMQMLRRYDISATVSIDGPAEIHDRLRGEGTFEVADDFARRCLDSGDIALDFECTYTNWHVEQGISVVDLIDFFADRYNRGVTHIAHVSAPEDSPLHLPEDVKREMYAEAARYSVRQLIEGRVRANSLSWRVMDALRTREPISVYCPAGSGTMAVDPEGWLYPCFMFAGEDDFRLARFTEDGRATDDRSADLIPTLSLCDKDAHSDCETCWAAPLCSGCIGGDFFACGDATARTSCDTQRAITEAVILEVAGMGGRL
ncbi:MAG: radical SAM protein [Armatimonadia bacterium]|nr:radical SAM protein [Armatimonadia bacterium]